MLIAKVLSIALLVSGLPALAGSAPGIKNFDRVDASVYRGGQPTAEGIRYLAKLGVRTVVDLREAGGRSEREQHLVTGSGMKYVNIPMTGFAAPTEAQITKILAILESGAAGPAFVHCLRGADRTGAVIAAYHIDHDKWDNARALKDARAHRMSFFQFPRQRYILSFRPLRQEARSAIASGATAPAAPVAAAAGAN